MQDINLQILTIHLLPAYLEQLPEGLVTNFSQLHDSELSVDNFSFYTSVSAVFSSKIEGEDIELDSFVKHKLTDAQYLPDHTQKIDDLYAAYEMAKDVTLDQDAVNRAHSLLTSNILHPSQRGRYRTGNMFVITKDARIEYVACLPQYVTTEVNKLFDDIDRLLASDLTTREAFYFAALIHLVFVKIHPYNDGNGRTARLLEKWFLAKKLGDKAWYLQSERMYYENHELYYKNIRKLGLEYPQLDYHQALPFLLMLPSSL